MEEQTIEIKINAFDLSGMVDNPSILVIGNDMCVQDIVKYVQCDRFIIFGEVEKYKNVMQDSILYPQYNHSIVKNIIDQQVEEQYKNKICIIFNQINTLVDDDIEELVMRGKRHNITMMMILNNIPKIGPMLRLKIDYILLSRNINESVMRQCYNHYCGFMSSYDAFVQIYNQITVNDAHFVISNYAKDEHLNIPIEKIFFYISKSSHPDIVQNHNNDVQDNNDIVQDYNDDEYAHNIPQFNLENLCKNPVINIIAKQNSEKIQLIENILYSFGNNVKRYVVFTSKNNYKQFNENFMPITIYHEYSSDVIIDILKGQYRRKRKHVVVIFDNCGKEYWQSFIRDDVCCDLLTLGRRLNITVIIVNEYYCALPPDLREQYNYSFFMENISISHRKKIYNIYFKNKCNISYDTFEHLYCKIAKNGTSLVLNHRSRCQQPILLYNASDCKNQNELISQNDSDSEGTVLSYISLGGGEYPSQKQSTESLSSISTCCEKNTSHQSEHCAHKCDAHKCDAHLCNVDQTIQLLQSIIDLNKNIVELMTKIVIKK